MMDIFPLRRTKLYRPRTTRELVYRPRVRDLLDCVSDPCLTLICAPAGFGKSTLLNDWLENCSTPNAWLSLDEGDSDLGVFLIYFAAAVRGLFPSACNDTIQLLSAPALPPMAHLVTALVNDLDLLGDDRSPARAGPLISDEAPGIAVPHPGAGARGRFILVLDDYHLLKGRDVSTFLSELLAHPPRPLHLVISTRQEPPLPLHAFRAQGKMTEIRVRDLRFTEDEVGAFMEQAVGVRLKPETLAMLTERTEGWATGLRLAALSLSAGVEPADADVPVLTDDRYALDYLLNEVLGKVPLVTQQFLLKTSILYRLSGPLCDAVVGPAVSGWDGQAYLDWLVSKNVFTFALDDEGTWFRYHHLFLKLLRSQLERQYTHEDIEELHRSAATWFADNGFVDEAIEHALLSGNELWAVQLLEVHRYEAMDQEQWRRLEHWLNLFPSQLVDSQPELLLLKAWVLQKQWRFTDLEPYLARLDALLERAPTSESSSDWLRGESDVLHCVLAYYSGDEQQAALHAELALQRTSGLCSFVRGTAWFYHAGARQMKGDLQGALDSLHSGLDENRLNCARPPMRLYTGLSIIYGNSMNLKCLLRVADQFQRASIHYDLPEATCWGYYFRGYALYHMDDLDGAEAAFSAVVERRYLAHGMAFSQSAFGVACIALVHGDRERALGMVELVSSYARETNNSRLAVDCETFYSYLAAQKGVLPSHWANPVPSDVDGRRAPLNTFVDPRLLRVRALLVLNTKTSLAKAATLLGEIRELAESGNNTRYLIEALALQALLDDLLGNRSAALASLRSATALAEPAGLVRIFVDLGPQIGVLLRELTRRTVPSEYLARVVAAFGRSDRQEALTPNKLPVAREYDSVATWPRRPESQDEGIIEPLSEREMDVLGLLAERFTNDEISHELHIASSTVKRHAVNIYQKLQVGGRRQAVARAVALGLIDPSRPGSTGRRPGREP